MWHPFQKKRQSLKISEETIEKINEESARIGITQVLYLKVSRDNVGMGYVNIDFTEKTKLDKGPIRFANKNDEILLSRGELRFEFGKFYFYPNVDLEWKRTPRPEIHQLLSNYTFTEEPIYLESENFLSLRPILKNCFQKEKVVSVYFKKNICQLEIPILTKEKEVRISDEILTYLSSLYLTPLAK
ncbi:hypothetical protein EHQ24_16920 [Leptospira noumeaensis]|uniref:Uncharacterized protein n=1 Tax=Leptospira noumeaensis TaxID=2484964 RepID=A0A4R9HZI8_9LEPT|nr:hypothetical protein [Leptospira noumeaensis]TGK78242.1 hypothetical protein EHQ24_16920 [Leptospira noumeaensis]